MGAAFTQRPELFRAVLCGFPDLDMVGYYRFPNNNPPALLEYGNAAKPEQFHFLYAYSPYQKVKGGTVPGRILHDRRRGHAGAAAAGTQDDGPGAGGHASGRPVLLLYDTKAGHAGGRPVGKVVEDESLELAFLAQQLGMEPTR